MYINAIPSYKGLHDEQIYSGMFWDFLARSRGELENLLDCPHYTRPEEHQGRVVPDVLRSGDHERIRRWRLKQALGRTWRWRPDLLEARRASGWTEEEQRLLNEYIEEYEQQYSDQ